MKKILFSSLVIVLLLGIAIPVMAQTETTYTGTVQSIDTTLGTFVLQVSETEIYTVTPPAGFDLTTLVVGGTVQVTGLLTETSLAATQVVVLEAKEFVGTVTAIDLVAGTFTFVTKEGLTFTVTAPEGFDLTTLKVGDVIILNGLQGVDTILATGIQLLFAGDGEGSKGGNYCENLADIHNVAERLAQRSGLYYEQIMSWFCVDGLGFGEIMNAIKASEQLGNATSVADIIAMKQELGGWGQVKQALGLNGNAHQTDVEDPEVVIEQANNGNSNHDRTQGPPMHANNDKDKPKKK